MPHLGLGMYDELPARSQYRAPREVRLGSVASVGLGSVAVVWCFSSVPCSGDGFFFPPPLSLPFLLFLPHLCVVASVSVLPPTRAILDHLRCLAADAGRTRAQLLGDERSGSF
jgi:hypothetical protein